MKKRLIYVVAIGIDIEEPVRLAWEFYCKKHDIDFEVITDSSVEGMAPHWERYTVIERFPDYDEYIYVDVDAMVKWDTPNLFEEINKFTINNIFGREIMDENVIYAVKDIGSLEWTHNSIQGYQDLFPTTTVNWWEYVTTGFLKFKNYHKVFFKTIIDFYKSHQEEFNKRSYETLRKGFDQTPFNYMVKELNQDLRIIPEIYSLGHLHKKDIFQNGMFLNIPAYIWQFNGMPKGTLKNVIDKIWQHIKEQYGH